jgi:hypothetical protein
MYVAGDAGVVSSKGSQQQALAPAAQRMSSVRVTDKREWRCEAERVGSF